MAQGEKQTRSIEEDDHVKLAILVRDVQQVNKNLDEVKEFISKFIEISDSKINREVYLADRDHQMKWNTMLEGRVLALENVNENEKIKKEALQSQTKKILGIGKEAWLIIFGIIQLMVIFGLIGAK